jgi:hypothetical protein
MLNSTSSSNYQNGGTYNSLDQWNGELSVRGVLKDLRLKARPWRSSHRPGSASSEKLRLPRHISSLEAPGRSRAVKACLHQAPKKCPLNQNASPVLANNQAIHMLQYQLQDTAFAEKYLENVRRNLQYRLEVAQLEENYQLVTMLQEEFRQLEASI